MVNHSHLYRVGKRLSRFLLVFFLLISLLLGIGWYLLHSDHPYVIRQIQNTAQKRWNADLTLQGYHLEWSQPFPTLSLQLRDLSLASADHPQNPLLKINAAHSAFDPWDLLMGNLKVEPLLLDSVWIHLYKDSLQNNNLTFAKDSSGQKRKRQAITLKEFSFIEINYLDFHRQDDYRHQWQWAKLSPAKIRPQLSEQGEWSVHLSSNCFFEGLVFKETDGAFLRQKKGQLDLHFSLAEQGKVIRLDQSSLQVDDNKFLLSGQLHRADTNRLQLQITNDGVSLKEALPLLSERVNLALRDIKIDQAIRAQFSFDNLMIPERKGAVNLDFSTADAELQFRKVQMSSVALEGHFSNDCDQDGIGNPATSCITIHRLDGDIFGVLSTKLHGLINNLKNPKVNAIGKVEMNLPELNNLLASKDKATFTKGHALVNFQYAGQLMNILDSPFEEQNIRVKGEATFEDLSVKMINRNEPLPELSGQMSFDESQTLLEDISFRWMGSNIHLTGRLSNLPEFLFYKDQSLRSDLRLHFDDLDLNKFIDQRPSNTQIKQSQNWNVDRLMQIARSTAYNVNGQVQVEIDRLIYDTLYLTDLQTQFRLFSPRRAEFVDSSMIRIDQLMAKFMGTTPVFVDLSLSRDSLAELLLDVHLPSAVEVAQAWLPEALEITEGNADLQLSVQLPLHALLQADRLRSEIAYKGLLNFDRVETRLNTFPWQLKKISGPLVFDSDQLLFDSLRFQYEGATFYLEGAIKDYAFFRTNNKKARVDLGLKGDYIDWRKKQAVSPKNTNQDFASPAYFFRSLDTLFYYATGKVNLQVDSILTEDHKIQPFLLEAQLLPDDDKQEWHQLKVDSFNFGFGGKDVVKGNARLIHPENPEIEVQMQARMTLEQMGKLLPSAYMDLNEGYLTLDLNYQSPLYDSLNAKNYLLNARVDGIGKLIKGNLFYNYRDFTFDDIYSHFSFDQKALYIRDLDMQVNGNRFIASGQSLDFFPFFILPDRRAHIELAVASPRFDFGKFTAPHGLGKDTTLVLLVDTTSNTLQQTVGYIDQLLDRGSIEMDTDCEELVYEEFTARNINGRISLEPDTVQLNNLRMDVANGTFKVDGLISDIVRHQPKMEVSMQLDQNNVREIFRQFGDFRQEQLGYVNIEGLASANVQFKANFNSNYSILPETMKGDMRVKLMEGQLIELNALKQLSGFLFRKRQLNHILIDTLEMFTHIRGTDLYVDNFYLHSSSFDFGAVGIYSLGAQKKTKILFSVPIRNLFRRHISREEMRTGNSKRKGMRLLIEARYKKERMRFRWKMFNWKKKKYRLIEE